MIRTRRIVSVACPRYSRLDPTAIAVAVGLLLLGLIVSRTQAQPAASYRPVVVGVIETGARLVVRAVSANGEIVGATRKPGIGHRGFLWSAGRREDVGGPTGTDWSAAHGINRAGVVVGSANTARAIRAFLVARPGGMRDLGTLPGDTGSEAFAINDSNEIAGYSTGPRGVQAVLWHA